VSGTRLSAGELLLAPNVVPKAENPP
jgi:hypothetical protein